MGNYGHIIWFCWFYSCIVGRGLHTTQKAQHLKVGCLLHCCWTELLCILWWLINRLISYRYLFVFALHLFSALKMLCCKSKISTPAEDKPPQVINLYQTLFFLFSTISVVKVFCVSHWSIRLCVWSPLMLKRWNPMPVTYRESTPSTTPQLNSSMPETLAFYDETGYQQRAELKIWLWSKLHMKNNTSGKIVISREHPRSKKRLNEEQKSHWLKRWKVMTKEHFS